MRRALLLIKVAVGALLYAFYVWIEAVRRTPEVKARKARRR